MYVRSDYRAKRGCICISQLVSQTAWQLHDPLALSCPRNNPGTGNRLNTLRLRTFRQPIPLEFIPPLSPLFLRLIEIYSLSFSTDERINPIPNGYFPP